MRCTNYDVRLLEGIEEFWILIRFLEVTYHVFLCISMHASVVKTSQCKVSTKNQEPVSSTRRGKRVSFGGGLSILGGVNFGERAIVVFS